MPDHATLELHFINVGQGDSILLVNRNLDALATEVRGRAGDVAFNAMSPLDHLPYAIGQALDLRGTVNQALLIDGGDDEYGGNVVEYLELHGVLDPRNKGYVANLALVISHYHDDHIGGARSLFKEAVAQQVTSQVRGRGRNAKTRTVTRTVWTLQPRYRPAHVYLTEPDEDEDPWSQRLFNLRADIDEATTQNAHPTLVTEVEPGGQITVTDNDGFETMEQLRIGLGDGAGGIPITLRAFAASRSVLEPRSGQVTAVPSGTRTPDQNDRSIMFVLQYGSFRAYLGGDLAGDGGPDGGNTDANAVDTTTKKFFSNHADVESTLNPVLEANLPATAAAQAGEPKFTVPGYCTVIKANHHASSSSVDVFTLSTTRPRIAVIPAGVRARFHRHPTQEVLNRMSPGQTPRWAVRPGSGVQGPVDNTLTGIYVSEIARQYKEKAFEVDAREALVVGDVIVRPVDESVVAIQEADAFGTPLRVQVYATGDQTAVDGDETALRGVDRGAPAAPYPIGPFMHTCDLH
jgi:beta-lactamase superfamily II metal-dependent hydrolase